MISVYRIEAELQREEFGMLGQVGRGANRGSESVWCGNLRATVSRTHSRSLFPFHSRFDSRYFRQSTCILIHQVENALSAEVQLDEIGVCHLGGNQ